MSQALASPSSCCSPCEDAPAEQLVGPQGKSAYQVAVDQGFVGTEAQWLASLDGANGLNAYTILAAFTAPSTGNFVQPAVGATIIATVGSSGWAVIGEDSVLEGGGYYLVTAIPDATHVTLQNRGYASNIAPGNSVAVGSRLAPAGIKGADGTNGTGDMLGANNLSDVASPSASVTNLGGSVVGAAVFGIASPSAIRFFRVNADNTVTLLSDADTRIALGLVIGTDVQADDDFLTSIAALGTAADKMIYTTGVNTAAEAAITAAGRSLVAQTTAAAMLTSLGKVLPRQGFLAKLTAVNMNATADTSMGIVATRFRVTAVIVEAATATLATAPCTGGLFKTAGGLNPICADQTLAACVLPINFASLTIGGIGLTDLFTADLIFRVGTPAGFAATANVFVFGEDLS